MMCPTCGKEWTKEDEEREEQERAKIKITYTKEELEKMILDLQEINDGHK